MPAMQAKYSHDEFARMGTAAYEKYAKSIVEIGNEGKFVAIDIETGDWELDSDDFLATERLLERCPDSQMWLVQVGRSSAYRIGGSRRTAVMP